MKRILLFSDIPPCENYSGGLVLKQLYDFLPGNMIRGVIVMDPSLDPVIPEKYHSIDLQIINKPRDNWGKKFKFKIFRQAFSLLMEIYNSLFQEQMIIKKVLDIIEDYKPDAIWIIIEGHSIIRMEEKLSRKTKILIYSLVWDPPGWWLRENKVNYFTSKQTIKRFQKLLILSKKTGTASWALSEEYEHLGADTIPLVASLDTSYLLQPAKKPHEREEFIITIAGQIYANTEWESLLKALAQMNWQFQEKPIKIRILSRYAVLWTNGFSNIEFLGWRTQEETISILSDSDILFCPYWFSEEFYEEARLSYPSKLTSYFASGRPVLFLGPEYSSPASLIKKFKVGLGCYSLNTTDIIEAISRLLSDFCLYSNIASNAHKFFQDYLSNQKLRTDFYDFLDLN